MFTQSKLDKPWVSQASLLDTVDAETRVAFFYAMGM